MPHHALGLSVPTVSHRVGREWHNQRQLAIELP